MALINFLFGVFFRKYDVNAEMKSFFSKTFLFSLLTLLVASYFSTGYHHYDEQWQILEFMSVKTGVSSKSLMPWEYTFKMRSWVQPYVYYVLSKALMLENPFSMAFVFRVFTALIGWYSLCLLSLSSYYLYSKEKSIKFATLCVHFCWFIPYLKVRPSSEGLASSVFVLGLAWLISEIYTKRESKDYSPMTIFFTGFVCGLSFLFRFQLGLMIFSTWLWMVFFSDIKFKTAFLYAIGVCLAVAIELPIDMWGYESPSFAPWNYYYQNLVLNKVSGFPTAPWWYYITASAARGIPPISILLIAVQIIFWVVRPKSIYTWSVIPLYIIHTIIPTKALRFIFPVMVVTPILIPFVHEYLKEKLRLYHSFSSTRAASIIFTFLIVINGVLFTQSCLRSAKSAVDLYQYVYNNSDKIKKIYHHGESPYENVGLQLMFYRPRNGIGLEKVADSIKVADLMKEKSNFYFMAKHGHEITNIENLGCTIKAMTYPKWVLQFNFFNWVNRSRVWTLFHCQ